MCGLREHDPRLGAYLSNAAPLYLLQCYLHRRLWILECPTACTHLYHLSLLTRSRCCVRVEALCHGGKNILEAFQKRGEAPAVPPSTSMYSFALAILGEGEKGS